MLIQYRNDVICCAVTLDAIMAQRAVGYGDPCTMSPISFLVSYMRSVLHIVSSTNISYSVLHYLGTSFHVQIILSWENPMVDNCSFTSCR